MVTKSSSTFRTGHAAIKPEPSGHAEDMRDMIRANDHGVSSMRDAKRILVVEDEEDLANLLEYNLQREGYEAVVAMDGRAALGEVERSLPDLILLDRMLPSLSGDEVIAQLRRQPRTSKLPIVMLTAKAEEVDELVGLGLGADDYITKPFSMKLLLARIAALFRRAEVSDAPSEVFTIGPITVDAARHEVTVEGRPVSVTATEFRLLKALIAAGGRVLSRSQLIDSVLGTGTAVTDRTIDVHITALRKKLGPVSRWIQTVRGVGYTFREMS
jgi:two-component system phosphate regulon response regulator PhoB